MNNMSEWQEEAAEKAEELAKQLVGLTNAFGSENHVARGISKAIAQEHNTLQQSFWRVMQSVIQTHADEKYTDLRNQASVDFCKAAAEVTLLHPLPMV